MAAPLYFFAKRSLADVVRDDRLSPALLNECGLAQTFADIKSVRRQCSLFDITTKGPSGSSGVFLYALPPDREAPKRCNFQPQFQEWREVHKSAGLWIGQDIEEPVRPRDLLREGGSTDIDGDPTAPHRGWPLELADGRRYTVPVIRRPDVVARHGREITNLPEDIGWDENGRFVQTVKREYLQIWEDAGRLCDFFFDAEGRHRRGDFEISVEDGLRWAIRILQLNYRYDAHLQNLLHLIDKTNVFAILGMAIDAPLVNHLVGAEKKRTDAQSTLEPANTSPGPKDGFPTTDQPAESCS